MRMRLPEPKGLKKKAYPLIKSYINWHHLKCSFSCWYTFFVRNIYASLTIGGSFPRSFPTVPRYDKIQLPPVSSFFPLEVGPTNSSESDSNRFHILNQMGKDSIFWFVERNVDVSENSGAPKSSILIGFSIINHPSWGTPIFGNIQM